MRHLGPQRPSRPPRAWHITVLALAASVCVLTLALWTHHRLGPVGENRDEACVDVSLGEAAPTPNNGPTALVSSQLRSPQLVPLRGYAFATLQDSGEGLVFSSYHTPSGNRTRRLIPKTQNLTHPMFSEATDDGLLIARRKDNGNLDAILLDRFGSIHEQHVHRNILRHPLRHRCGGLAQGSTVGFAYLSDAQTLRVATLSDRGRPLRDVLITTGQGTIAPACAVTRDEGAIIVSWLQGGTLYAARVVHDAEPQITTLSHTIESSLSDVEAIAMGTDRALVVALQGRSQAVIRKNHIATFDLSTGRERCNRELHSTVLQSHVSKMVTTPSGVVALHRYESFGVDRDDPHNGVLELMTVSDACDFTSRTLVSEVERGSVLGAAAAWNNKELGVYWFEEHANGRRHERFERR